MKSIATLFFLLAFLAAQMAGAATITVTSTADSGAGTLRDALASAVDGDTIDATGVSGTILLTGGELVVTRNLNIVGPGPVNLAADGNHTNRVFHIGSNIVVSISGLTITNGFVIYPGDGGGIYNDHATLTVSNSMISGNSAFHGGGIYNSGIGQGSATLTIVNSTISGNSSPFQDGGGIYNAGFNNGSATVIIANSSVNGNLAAFRGGGLFNGSATMMITNSTISGNSASLGGGSLNAGTLTFIDSTINNNSANSNNLGSGDGGGIENYGTLTIANTTINGNSASGPGGGINSFGGTLTIGNSTISGNSSAIRGGGIENRGTYGTATLTITNSTFSDNSAPSGGGIANLGSSGNATLMIANSTFSSNSASGIDNYNNVGSATVTIVNSTISGNSSVGVVGIRNFNNSIPYGNATLEIGDTILNGAPGGNIANIFGTVTSLGYNLSSDNGGGFLTNTTDQINTDPILGPLQDNGGPTFTHALLPGSPAIDLGKNFSASTTDQRDVGFARTFNDPAMANAPGGDATDIGAFEVQPTAPCSTIVTTTADSGPGSLRSALACAVDGDTIDASGVSGTILLTSGELLVNKSVSIIGIGPANLAVDGNATSRVFHIGSNTVVSISGLTIANGSTPNPGSGGGIWNDHATLTVSNCTVTGNSTTFDGGGIYNDAEFGGSATLAVLNSIISGNSAFDGGGIYNNGGFSGGTATVTIADSIIGSNSARGGGGIVTFRGLGNATLTVTSSIISSNSASYFGGGVWNQGGTLNIADSAISGNSAGFGAGIFGGGGGGLLNQGGVLDGKLTLSNSIISGNSAHQGGGGILNSSAATAMVVDSVIRDNFAGAEGGGIYNVTVAFHSGQGDNATLTIEKSTLSGNFSESFGGGIANANFAYESGSFSTATVTITNCTLSGNAANGAFGGNILNDGDGGIAMFRIANCTLTTGGIFNATALFGYPGGSATMNIGSTILSAGASRANITNEQGTVTSLGYNLSSDDGGGFLNHPTDILNTDPLLGPLQDNGGPTFTHALLCGSPAIDQGKNFSASATDQRGAALARIVDDPAVPNAAGGDGTDIGAFEVQQGDCAPPDTDGDGVPDAIDQCPDTHPGAIVNATGCSIDQLVPCGGPRSGGKWKNHGQYVSAVTHEANKFLAAGLITGAQKGAIVAKAAQSNCGK